MGVYSHMCKIDPLIPLGSGQSLKRGSSVDRTAAFPGAEPGQGELPGKVLLPTLSSPPHTPGGPHSSEVSYSDLIASSGPSKCLEGIISIKRKVLKVKIIYLNV